MPQLRPTTGSGRISFTWDCRRVAKRLGYARSWSRRLGNPGFGELTRSQEKPPLGATLPCNLRSYGLRGSLLRNGANCISATRLGLPRQETHRG